MNAEAPLRLGDFEIVRELGRGGMGVVYEARQLSLKRKVALKVLAVGLGLSTNAVERFRREAEAAAKLHHTNIVPVYATGEHDGVHFYAMELIAGPSLDHVIKQLRLQSGASRQPEATTELATTGPYAANAGSSSEGGSSSALGSGSSYFDTVARRVAEVADALAYAHQQGIVHRDVKPSNLLLSPEGRLSLNDFGLARILEQPGMTMTGEFVGTPAYVSPEQITSGRIPLDHRTDVYSLGATLYELLTLQAPFRGDSRDRVLAQIIQKEPTPTRALNKQVPRDLETICLKAMEKDPDRRYQTAGQMAEDLRRYVNRFAILARRAGPVERCRKWVRRHPGLAGSLACALLALVAAGFFAWVAYDAWEKARETARQNAIDKALVAAMGGDLDTAERAIKEAEDLGAKKGQIHMLRGQVALHRGQTSTAIEELEEAVTRLPESVAARGMLLVAYAYNGQWDRYAANLEQLEKLTPITAEDFLFKGYAEGQHNPKGGLETINMAIDKRPMLVAHLLRAELSVWLAQDEGTTKAAEKATEAAKRARDLLSNNPMALWVSLHANVVAAGIYEVDKQPNERQRVMQAARTDAEDLKQFTKTTGKGFLPDAAVYRWLYWREACKDGGSKKLEEEVLDELCWASDNTNHLYAAFCYALTLYRNGKLDGANEVLGIRNGRYHDCLRPFVLADHGDREKAHVACTTLAKESEDGLTRLDAYMVLLLLGDRDFAISKCKELHEQGERFSVLRREHLLRCVAYVAGGEREQPLLDKASNSRWNQCLAHYYIGMKKLAEGKPKQARDHFEQAVETQAFGWFAYDMSWALLGRLENKGWPPWLKKE